MIELQNVTKDFGEGEGQIHAVHDISLTIEDGEIFGIIGLSGAGKTRVINALEDIGFYCVDNIPPALLGGFADLCYSPAAHHGRSAIVMDSRSGKMFRELPHALEELRCRHIPYRILFLEASAEVLLRRYKETRRRHPLLDECDGCLEDAIREERRLLKPIRDAADYIIDTTSLSPSQLRGRIVTIFEGETTPMLISCQSFGFRNGLPQDADLVFDVRCLPNPYYSPELRPLTGLDAPVASYLAQEPLVSEMIDDIAAFIAKWLPHYRGQNRHYLTICIGCTGGQHRSVYVAEMLGRRFADQAGTIVRHRALSANLLPENKLQTL